MRRKITEEEVKEMRDLKRQGLSVGEIAKKVGVHRRTVQRYILPEEPKYVAPEKPKPAYEGILAKAVNMVKKVALEKHKEEMRTGTGFICLLSEQVGQVANRYWHEGKKSYRLPVDIADVIADSIAFLNWLGLTPEDVDKAFEAALGKMSIAIKLPSPKEE